MGEPTNESVSEHADKYNDPRAKVTRRGVLMGLGVVVLGVFGSAASIYARKTRLEKSTEFWGPDTILGLQLAERIQMISVCGEEFEPVELTATPGLGHLRHALLDERSYDWDSASDQNVMEMCTTKDDRCVELQLTDPTAHRFEPIFITVDLTNGWVGPSNGTKRVQTTKRVRPALGKFLKMLVNVEQLRYDLRD